jgi:hypothetical protein
MWLTLCSSCTGRYWEVEGREEELKHDDGVYNSHEHTVTGRPGQMIAVGFQAPTWANFVTKMIFYNANDNETNQENPEAPSTYPFTAWIWRPVGNMPSNIPGNDGYVPFQEYAMYPEDEWIIVTYPTAINITDNSHYPDKQFFVGLEWQYRHSPHIYEDHSDPIAYRSFFYDYSEVWEVRTQANTMIRAVVSDVPSLEGKGRELVLTPTRLSR